MAKKKDLPARGTVVRIELTNFMTYNHVIVEPGPRLNLILGPNGSGKSTVVCALCLGLGGSQKLLGRSERLGDFVKVRGIAEGTRFHVDMFHYFFSECLEMGGISSKEGKLVVNRK